MFERICQVKILVGDGFMPEKGTLESAGWDLKAVENGFINGGGHGKIRLGFCSEFPRMTVALLRDRSSLALKYQVFVTAGVIDSDYRNEWAVILNNMGLGPFAYKRGDKIAQALFLNLAPIHMTSVTELSLSQRKGGFGSTGK